MKQYPNERLDGEVERNSIQTKQYPNSGTKRRLNETKQCPNGRRKQCLSKMVKRNGAQTKRNGVQMVEGNNV